MNKFIAVPVRLGCFALAGLLTGCETTDVAHEGHQASVEIIGHSTEEIRQATEDVFSWGGYKETTSLTFEKKGSGWDTATYGGLSGNPVWIKMRVSLISRGENVHVLGCDAFIVEDHDQGFMETERKLKMAKRDEAKKLLDQIKTRLSLPVPKQP